MVPEDPTEPAADAEPGGSAARRIVVATGNPGKLREIRQVLADLPVRVTGLDELPAIPEPAETGETFAENARQKALYYARRTGRWCLADDSGLVVDALDGAPGVHSARYAAAEMNPRDDRAARDAANTTKLLAALEGVEEARRAARFVCHLALADGDRVLIETSGVLAGWIAFEPRGQNGFGYDPVFLVPDRQRTAAELEPWEKNEISHRGQAVRRFAERLGDFLAGGSG